MLLVFDYATFVGLSDKISTLSLKGQTQMATKAPTKAQIMAAAKKAKAVPVADAPAVAAAPSPFGMQAPVAAAVGGPDMAALSALVTATQGPSGFCFMAGEVSAPLVAMGYAEVREEMTDTGAPDSIPRHSVPGFASRASEAGIAALSQAGYTAAQTASTAPVPVSSPAQAKAEAAAHVAPPAAAFAVPPVVDVEPIASDASPTAPGAFKIVTGVPVPAAKRFGKSSVYPFASLEVNQAFFVPATAERDNPAKSMASTVNSAKARFAVQQGYEEDGTTPRFVNTKEFVLRNIADGEAFGYKGVRGAAIWRTK